MLTNKNVFKYDYYDRVTVLNFDEFILPLEVNNITFDNLIKRFNLTIGSDAKAITVPELIRVKPYNYINPVNAGTTIVKGDVFGSNGLVSDMYKLIPVRVTIRKYKGTYHIQTKVSDTIITEDTFLFLLNDPLTIKKDYDEGNDILVNSGKYMRKGDYFDLIVTADMLITIGLYVAEIRDLDIDTTEYGYILASVPDVMINGVVKNMSPIKYVGSIGTYKNMWLSCTLVDNIVNSDVETTRSHVVRKFIHELQREYITEVDGEYNNYHNVILTQSYLNRVWTDDIQQFVVDYYNDVLSENVDIGWEFRRTICLYKKGDIAITDKLPADVRLSADKMYVLNKIRDMVI